MADVLATGLAVASAPAVLAVLAVLGRRYAGQESAAVAAQGAAADEWRSLYLAAREAAAADAAAHAAALASEVMARQSAEARVRQLEARAGVPRRRRSDGQADEQWP